MLAVSNKISSLDLSQIVIRGSVGNLLDRLVENRITSDEAKSVIYQEAEDAFKNQVDDQTIVGYWQGEFWGKWMISAARVCRYLGHEDLRAFIDTAAHRLISYQREDGYIGTYRDSGNVFACDRDKARAVVGWPCNWNWNIWCRKYTLWGLLEAYQLLGDQTILDAAVRFADQLIGELHDHSIQLCDTGTFNGLPSGSIIKPMTLLWELTGSQRYLSFAVEAAESWDRPDGRIPNLIANARSKKPLHTWYPEPQTWAKAYELMSCLDGLLALYRATGTAKYMHAVETIHCLLEQDEKNILFSVGFNDIFAHAAPLINAVSEACDVIHWMRINYELFALTGQSRYMDLFELAFYNAFLASVYSDGRWGSRGVRSSGRHITSYQTGLRHNHCCVNNLPRGFMNMAQAAVMLEGDAICINLYSEWTAKITLPDGRMANINLGGSFLQEGHAVITVAITGGDPGSQDRSVPLKIRIPAWSHQTTVNVNSRSLTPPAGGYLSLDVTPGQTVLDVHFDLTPRLAIFPVEPVHYAPDDFRSQRWTLDATNPISYVPYEDMVWQRMHTLQVGPLLLARSKKIGHTEQTLFSGRSLCTPGMACRVTPQPLPGVCCGFLVALGDPDHLVRTVMCDYASAANDILDDPRSFCIYL